MRLNCAAGFVAARGHWHPHFPLYKHPSQLLKKIFNVKHRKSIMLKRLKWAVLPRVLVLDRPSVWGSSSVALSSHQTPWRLCIETPKTHDHTVLHGSPSRRWENTAGGRRFARPLSVTEAERGRKSCASSSFQAGLTICGAAHAQSLTHSLLITLCLPPHYHNHTHTHTLI